MQASNTFKNVFLKKLLMGFKVGDFSSKNMTLLERKRAIKLSADVAFASAARSDHGRRRRNWSRAIISNVLKEEKNSSSSLVIIRTILGKEFESKTSVSLGAANFMYCKRGRSKKIVKSSKVMHRNIIRKRRSFPSVPDQKMVVASTAIIAKRMMRVMQKIRIQKLKCLVPGGESLDHGLGLLDETVDYIKHLKAQVDVMRLLTNAVQGPSIHHKAMI